MLVFAEYRQQTGRWPVQLAELPDRSDAVDPDTNQLFSYSFRDADEYPLSRSSGILTLQF